MIVKLLLLPFLFFISTYIENSNIVNLESIWGYSSGLTALDVSDDDSLTYLNMANSQLTILTPDTIINDLVTDGASSGTLNISDHLGLPLTATSFNSYIDLETKEWTVDVANSTPADTEGPTIGTLSYVNETDTAVELSCTAIGNIAVTRFNIYLDSILDRNVPSSSLSSSSFDGLTAETNYDIFVTAKDAADNESLASNIINFTTDSTAVTSDGLSPVVSNFRVENGFEDRVYFDSSEVIIASTGVNGYTGFTITDKVIKQITINVGSLTNHYLTVTVDFDFWDNNTIRYGGRSDLADSESNVLLNFDLQYITNKIDEPTASTAKYVTVEGAGISDGSLGNEWTLTEACEQASAGDHVNIEKGDYGNTKYVISVSGTVDEPIIFEGYNTTPGDSPSLTMTPTTVLDDSVMPWIHDVSSSDKDDIGLDLSDENFIIIRNIIVEGNYSSIKTAGCQMVILDNTYTRGSFEFNINGFSGGSNGVQQRVINSYTSDSGGNGIAMIGQRHLSDNNYITTGEEGGNQDYHMVIYAGGGVGEHIVRNITINRNIADVHSGHGLSLKGGSIENTLTENCTLYNMGGAIEARHHNVKYNVWRNIYIDNGGNDDSYCAMRVTGAQYNIFDNITLLDSRYVVWWIAGSESPGALTSGNNNLIKNSVFYMTDPDTYDGTAVFRLSEDTKGLDRVPNDNTFANCTFYGYQSMYLQAANEAGTGNRFVNCIFDTIKNEYVIKNTTANWAFTYTDFYSASPSDWSYTATSGRGNISVDPIFTDKKRGRFRLSINTPASVYKGGTDVGVYYDAKGIERKTSFSMGMDEWNGVQ